MHASARVLQGKAANRELVYGRDDGCQEENITFEKRCSEKMLKGGVQNILFAMILISVVSVLLLHYSCVFY